MMIFNVDKLWIQGFIVIINIDIESGCHDCLTVTGTFVEQSLVR